MSSQFAGDPASFPTDFTIPDDSVPPTAAAFNVALEALGDRTAYLRGWLVRQAPVVVTSTSGTTSVVVPAGVRVAQAVGYGAGGGGAQGTATDSTGLDDLISPGGGGGGGAPMITRTFPVTPGETLTVTIGVSASWSDGAPTTIRAARR